MRASVLGRSAPGDRAIRLLLIGGVCGGFALALLGMMAPAEPPLPPASVARVNGRDIDRADYARSLDALARDARDPVDAVDREWVMGRLVEEELLVQRALELGLPEHDPALRQAVVRTMIDAILADAASAAPTEAQLVAVFEAEPGFFGSSDRIGVRRLRFSTSTTHGQQGDPAARAHLARERLAAGVPFETVERELADEDLAAPPGEALHASKLREYLGPLQLDVVVRLAPGALSEPIAAGPDLYLLQRTAADRASAPTFAQVREQVASEWSRRRRDRAFREYLDALRAQASIQVAPR